MKRNIVFCYVYLRKKKTDIYEGYSMIDGKQGDPFRAHPPSRLILVITIVISMLPFVLRSLSQRPQLFSRKASLSSPQLQQSMHRQASFFCDSKAQSPEDELTSYERFLGKFNDSIRKPHERMRSEEERIVQKYLNERKFPQIISFLSNNCNNTLGDANTASKIDEQLAKNWQCLSAKEQLSAAYSLCQLREPKAFQLFKQPIEKRLRSKGISGVECEQLIIFLCGELINRKSLRFFGKLHPQIKERKEIYEKIYHYIDKKHYHGTYSKEKRSLLQYIGLMLDPTLNKKEDSLPDRERSPLEVKIESFLGVLDVQYERQVRINEYYVDYLVKVKREGGVREFILEANGNHHYTITDRLKGREVLRDLIVNEYAPLRILHYHDFLLSKGHRNKLAYIEGLFEEKMINWECRKQGKNSRWEVRVDEELIDSVRDQ